MAADPTDRLPIPGPGRSSKYRDEYADQAKKLCLLGFTDEQLAEFFDVAVSTIYVWKNEYPAFSEAIRAGKTVADAEVAAGLYRKATGEYVTVSKVVKTKAGDYAAVEFIQYVEPDANAARLWLTNRQPKLWRDRQEKVLSGPNGGPIAIDASKLSDDAIEQFLAAADAATDEG